MSVKLPPGHAPAVAPVHTTPQRGANENKTDVPQHQHGHHKGAHFRSSPHGAAKPKPQSPLPRRRPPAANSASASAANAFGDLDADEGKDQVDTQSSKSDNKNFTDSDDGGRENQFRQRLVGTMRQIGARAADPVDKADKASGGAASASLPLLAQRLMHVADSAASLGASTQAIMGELRNILAALGPKGLPAGGLAAVRTALVAASAERTGAASNTLRSINSLLPLMLLNLQRERTEEQHQLALSKLDVLTRRARTSGG
jgi:hypothetical protein